MTTNLWPRELMAYLEARKDEMVRLLGELVALESPSDDKPALDRFSRHLASLFQSLGARTEIIPVKEGGDHLRAEFDPAGKSGQILLLAHMDTVWAVGEIRKRPFRVEGNRAYGPGAFDMKGGIVQALFALAALRDLGRGRRRLVFLCNSDEELGSRTSRDLIEAEATRSDYVLVLEPGVPPDGALETFRKGCAQFRLRISGLAAHCGADPGRGVSAVDELARQILRLHALNDPATGITVNVGVVSGGTRVNVTAPWAEALVDVRVPSSEAARRLEAEIKGIQPILPGAGVEVSGGVVRMPMERTPQVMAMYERARTLAVELGFELREAATGGFSDGNLTAALGIPTLDGLGPEGAGGHALDEYVNIGAMPRRAGLLARLLETL